MTRILPVRLAQGSRPLWFDIANVDAHKGDAVVVLTARGVEYGYAVDEPFDATEEQLEPLKASLKPVKRLGTEKDAQQYEKMRELSDAALPIFRQIVAESGIDMHPVSVEYLFEGGKATFYFDAEDRVDFRDLVRKLASEFHVRVDMRQIGPRDEARMIGGLGHCGQELCCKRFGGDLCAISIRMAKEQDLSLNPTKISGLCGKLMCCLRYEYEAYKDFKSRAPKIGASISVPDGTCKVCEYKVPREVIVLETEDGKRVSVPLADMAFSNKKATRPDEVSAEAWNRACNPDPMTSLIESNLFTSQFTGEETLAKPVAVRRNASASQQKSEEPRKLSTKLSKKILAEGKRGQKSVAEKTSTQGAGAKGASSQGVAAHGTEAAVSARKSRRRSTLVSSDGTAQALTTKESHEAAVAKAYSDNGSHGASASSTQVKRTQEKRAQDNKANAKNDAVKNNKNNGAQKSENAHEKQAQNVNQHGKRRGEQRNRQSNAHGNQAHQASQANQARQTSQRGETSHQTSQTMQQNVRPGRNSSALRNLQNKDAGNGATSANANGQSSQHQNSQHQNSASQNSGNQNANNHNTNRPHKRRHRASRPGNNTRQ
jgi:cell fate regulator YaaT (PSP1 superfamily)